MTATDRSPDVDTVAPEPLLAGESIVKQYGSSSAAHARAVDVVDIAVAPGETLGLVGESGCGKSTLARCLTRLTELTSGRVRFDGVDITCLGGADLRSLRRHFQMVFQDPAGSLDPRQKVREILLEGLHAHRIGTRAERFDRVRATVEAVGLPSDALDRFPREFSGGQQQRIGIARALVLEPRLLVADEPVTALDVSIQAQVLNLIASLKASLGLSMLFVAHDLAVVGYISDRIAVMYLGKIVELGTVEEVMEHPRHPYTVGLLSSIPEPDVAARARPLAIRASRGELITPTGGCRYRPRCPARQAICATSEPALTGVGHQVACHFPGALPAPAHGLKLTSDPSLKYQGGIR